MDNQQTTQPAPVASGGMVGQTYADKLKAIEAQVANIRTQATGIAGQAATIAEQQGKPQLASDIRATFPVVSNASQAVDLSLPNKVMATDAQSATQRISANTNNLSVPEVPPQGMSPIPYLMPSEGQDYGWRAVLDEMKAMQAGQTSQEQKTRDVYKEYGIAESFETLKTLNSQALSIRTEMDKLDQQELAEITTSEGRSASTSFVSGEKLKIQNDYAKRKAVLAGELGSYTSQAQMVQGNVQMAKSLADSIVSAATYDQEQRWKSFDYFYDANKELINNLESDYKTALDAAYSKAKQDYDTATTQRKQIVSWATNPETAPAFYGTNLSTISFDDATGMVRDYFTLHAIKNGEDLLSVDEAQKLNVPYGTTKKEAAAKGIIPAGTATDSTRVNTISAFINKNKGTDGLIAWETYADAAQKWISMGGTTADFKVAFPPERLMNQGNQNALPSSLKPYSADDFYNNL